MSKFILVLIFLSFNANAQKSVYTLESVSHTQQTYEGEFEENESSAITNIEKEEIQNANVSSIDDLLRLNSNVTTSRGPRSFGEAPQVRGLDTGKVFIYVDGERQNFQAGHTSMLAFDVENIKSVSVHENSTDFSKTGTLSGGVIFRTIEPEDIIKVGNNFGTQFKTQRNSANAETVLNVKNAYRSKKQSALLSYSNKDASNLALNDGTELENSAYTENNFMGKYKNGNFKLKYEYFNREDLSPLDPSLNPPGRLESLLGESDLTKNTIALSYENKKFRSNLYRNSLVMTKINRETNVSETREIETIGGDYITKIGNWKLGADLAIDNLNSEEDGASINAYPRAQKIESTAFVERKIIYNDLILAPGLKVNYYNMSLDNNEFEQRNNTALTRKLQSQYKMGKFTVEANYVESINTPKVQQVYPTGLHSEGDDFIFRDNFFKPNLGLKHETSVQKDFKVSYVSQAFNDYDMLSVSYSYFDNDIQDYIFTERIDRSILDEENGTTQFVNIPDAHLYGENIEVKYLYDQFEANFTYAKIRGRNETLNMYLEDLPADTYLYNLKYTLEDLKLSFGYQGIQAQKQNRTNPQSLQRTEKTPGYFIHNVFVNKRFLTHWNANLRIDNLGNQKYRRHGSHLFESEEDIKIALTYSL